MRSATSLSLISIAALALALAACGGSTGDPLDAGLVDAVLGAGGQQLDEDGGGARETESIQRCAGERLDVDGSSFIVAAPTPGALTSSPPCP